MALQKGDFILIDYVAKVKETNEVFDTTQEEVAKKEHLHKEGRIYEPKLVVIGERWVMEALDESLKTMEVAKAATVEISPEKGFGPRDPEKIKRVPIKQLYAKEINPVIGAQIEFQGKDAIVRSVGAGRVLLDFNHSLAGRTLVYEVTVTKQLKGKEDKIAALAHRRIPVVEEGKFKLTIKTTTLTIDVPEDAFYIEHLEIYKRGIAMDIQKFVPDFTEIKFVETFKSEPKPEAAPAPAPKPAPAAKAPAAEAPAPAEEKPAEDAKTEAPQ